MKCLFFGPAAELAGSSQVEIPLAGPVSLDIIYEKLQLTIPDPLFLAWLNSKRYGLAVNEEYIDKDQAVVIRDSDEILFIPPVSGG